MNADTKNRVLFLCTGNSCRSQMAEAIVNHDMGDRWHAFSAGTQPAGYVHPRALQVLEEIGINHTGRSKNVNQFRDQSFHLVITVCDQASEECPLWLGEGQVIHSGYQDPAQATGSTEEILTVFRRVRDRIHARIPELLAEYSSKEKDQESEDHDG